MRTPALTVDNHASGESSGARAQGGRLALPVIAFLIALVIPLVLQVGPLKLSASRLVLLVMVLPCTFLWMSGRAGPIRKADICVILICVWTSILLLVRGEGTPIQGSGMLFIETMGPYFLARCFIRTPEQFHQMVKILLVIIIAMIPFLLYENVSHVDWILRLFQKIGPVIAEVHIPGRLGFDRAQGPFEHPILLGVFCGSLLGLSYYVIGYGRGRITPIASAAAVALAAFTGLSSGPISGVMVQIMMIIWDNLFGRVKSRWRIFAYLLIFCYVFIDVFSNRPPFLVLVSYFALNAQTGYGRMMIWHWGWVNIFHHPLFGIGLADWERSWVMTDSFDMFWLLNGMRNGILAMAFYFLAFFLNVIPIARKKINDERIHSYKMGYILCMGYFFICGWMVHYWTASYQMLFFMIASGVWLLDYDEDGFGEAGIAVDAAADLPRKRSRTVL